MRNALLAVDLQAGFVQGGSAPVPNGMRVAEMIARHIRHFKTEYQCVVASRDYHEDPTDHFSNTPDFLTTWPPHCVIGTPGAAFVPPIANLVREKLIQSVVSKGRHNAAYSAFEGLDARGHGLLDVLKEERIDHIDVCGIATDYCVRLSALPAPNTPFQTPLLFTLSPALTKPTGHQPIEGMNAAGCQVQAATAP